MSQDFEKDMLVHLKTNQTDVVLIEHYSNARFTSQKKKKNLYKGCPESFATNSIPLNAFSVHQIFHICISRNFIAIILTSIFIRIVSMFDY